MRQRRQAISERLEIEHGPADQERDAAARLYVRNGAQRIGSKSCRRIRLVRVDEIDEMVRNPSAQARVGLCRSDIHAAIDLRRIDADDLDGQAGGELDRDRALA